MMAMTWAKKTLKQCWKIWKNEIREETRRQNVITAWSIDCQRMQQNTTTLDKKSNAIKNKVSEFPESRNTQERNMAF